jgi:CMP/dCMP kinase
MSIKEPLQIAIDGPVASGKGEIASRLACKLGAFYVYTGAMYRALGLACIEHNISTKDASRVVDLLQKITIKLTEPKDTIHSYTVLLDGRDVTERIEKPDTAQAASDVGTIAKVREWMVTRQQQLAIGKSVVMEGRDIAKRVLPHAKLKIYLTASAMERAKRRLLQFQQKGLQKTFEETLSEIKIRDTQDTTRTIDPLKIEEDVWELDTTNMKPDEVIDTIVVELQKKGFI